VRVLLRHWREKRGWSMRRLAGKADVSYVTVARIEHGEMSPTLEMLEKLAKALDIDVRDFFPPSGRSKRSQRRR